MDSCTYSFVGLRVQKSLLKSHLLGDCSFSQLKIEYPPLPTLVGICTLYALVISVYGAELHANSPSFTS